MSVCDREGERGVTTQLTWFIHILTIHVCHLEASNTIGHVVIILGCHDLQRSWGMTVTTLQTPRWLQSGKGRRSRLSSRSDTRPHKTSQLSNTSRIPVIGALFQLASESQMLLTFLGNSCLNDHSQHMSSSSLRSLVRRRRHKQAKKLFDEETDNPEIFPAAAIKVWQLWPHASVSANKSIIYVQWYIFVCLVSLDC